MAINSEKLSTNFNYFDNLQSILCWEPSPKCNEEIKQHKLENFKWNNCQPRTLVCHDHRGGYLEYESLCGSKCTDQQANDSSEFIPFYNFFHWWHVDIFVYFSHHFVTIPPPLWTIQAHKHGVLMLGTFITESDQICAEIFSNSNNVEQLIARLVELCRIYNFDGWLINIENKIEPEHLEPLKYFLKKLRQDLRTEIHNCTQVIWYDSVTETGELKWQNELNDKNKHWFNFVDGFYTNYNWTEMHLQRTLLTFFSEFNATKSAFDIYIGIDVFGRGCPGGGGWNCSEPMECIRRFGLSSAIFAPGWICEKFPDGGQKCLFQNSFRFWNGLKAHLFPHKLTSRKIQTNFSVGFTSENEEDEENGQKCKGMNNFNMRNSSLQPFYLNSASAISKDLCPGLIICGGGVHDLFLCDNPIGQCDRGLELNYKSSDKIGIIINLTRGNNDEFAQLAINCKFQQPEMENVPTKLKRIEKMSSNVDESSATQKQQFQVEIKRENIPIEQRQRQFRQLLRENKINSNSNWEEELPNLICDERYLLLGAAERKLAFENFCQNPSAEENEQIGIDENKSVANLIQSTSNVLQTSAAELINEWIPLNDKFGWKISKISLWIPPNGKQNIRLFSFGMILK